MFTGLATTGTYFNQIFSLSSSPVSSFSVSNWTSLVQTIMGLLSNPWFLGFIGILVIMSILPKFED